MGLVLWCCPVRRATFLKARTNTRLRAPHPQHNRWRFWRRRSPTAAVGVALEDVRTVGLIQGKVRQRKITERLLLGALREQDVARGAVEASDRANYLAKASRELRPGSWLASLEFEVDSRRPTWVFVCADGRPLWLYRMTAAR